MRQTAAMGLSVPFSIGLTLPYLDILYATKQNKNHYHQTRFQGLKYPQNTFAPDPAGGAYSAPPDPIAALGKERGWDGREGRTGKEGEGGREKQGRGGKEKAGEGMPPLFGSSLRP